MLAAPAREPVTHFESALGEGLSRELTIVIIAQRLSTIQRCDRVIRLQHGCTAAEGPPWVVLTSP